MSLPSFSLARPVTTAMAITGALALGFLSLDRIPLEYMPEMSGRAATVTVPYRSSSPEEIERLLVRPLEDRLATLPQLDSISSTATSSSATVRVEFDWDVDMDLMALEIRERIELAMPDLPEGTDRPGIRRFSTADFSVVHLSVSWEGAQDELESVVEGRVVPGLSRLPGVAAIEVHGLNGKRVLIETDRDRMESHGISPFSVQSGIQQAHVNTPAGSVVVAGRKHYLRAVGEVESMRELAALPLGDGQVSLEDVAAVDLRYPEPTRVQQLDGRDAVTIEVYKTSDGNMVTVAADTRAAIASLMATPGLEDLRIRVVKDRSREVMRSLSKLRGAGLWGGLLAAGVLLLFLRQVRATIIVLVSIPTSVMVTLAAMFVLRESGLSVVTLNIVSLTGLMLAVGMIVDNAVVVMENIHRKCREGMPAREAALQGASEVTAAVVASTLTTVVVFGSLLGGVQDRFARWLGEFGLAMTVALLASLAVALSLVPLAAASLFRRPVRERKDGLPRLTRWYRGGLGFALRARCGVLALSILAVWGAWELIGTVGRQPAPRSAERRITVDVQTGHGFSMEEYASLFDRLEEAINPHRDELEIDAIVSEYGTSRRRSWQARANLRLYLTEGDAQKRATSDIKEDVRKLLPVIPGVSYRLERLRHWSGSQDIGVEISGRDGTLLATVAGDVQDRLDRVAGLNDIETNLESGEEEIRIIVDRDRAMEAELSPRSVARAVSSALGERPVARYRTSDREIDILVRFEGSQRASLADLQEVSVMSARGRLTPLSTVASFEKQPGPRLLRRQDRKRTLTITGEPAEGGFFMAGSAVEQMMKETPLPAGISWKMGRTFRRFGQDQASSLGRLGLAILLVYLLLASLFESLVHPFTILMSVPFALTGVAVLFWVTNTPLDHMAYLGFLVLAGLVVNNGILLVHATNRLRRDEGLARTEAILQAGALRLRPILITTLTTLVGLFPLVAPSLAPEIFGEVEGRSRQWAPVALAVFGGLLTSTPLTLIVTPIVYSVLDDLGSFARRTLSGAGLGSSSIVASTERA